MNVENLKNYGVGLSRQLSTLPAEVKKEIYTLGAKIILDQIGFLRLPGLVVRYLVERRRMKRIDLSPVREMGMKDERFIREQVEFAAVFSAIKKSAGAEKMGKIIDLVSEKIGGETLKHVMPPPDDFLKFEDPFRAYSEYVMSVMEGDEREGCHHFDIVENSDDAFHMNITYCAWFDIYNRLGITEACLVSCNSDDALLPGYLEKLGGKFSRSGTLARGATVCDFRFDRLTKK